MQQAWRLGQQHLSEGQQLLPSLLRGHMTFLHGDNIWGTAGAERIYRTKQVSRQSELLPAKGLKNRIRLEILSLLVSSFTLKLGSTHEEGDWV